MGLYARSSYIHSPQYFLVWALEESQESLDSLHCRVFEGKGVYSADMSVDSYANPFGQLAHLWLQGLKSNQVIGGHSCY